MTSRVNTLRNVAMMGILLLMTATTTGCGVGLPTQPEVDPGAPAARSATGLGATESGDLMEMGDPTGSLGVPATSPAVAPGEEIVPTPGPNVGPWKGAKRRGPKK